VKGKETFKIRGRMMLRKGEVQNVLEEMGKQIKEAMERAEREKEEEKKKGGGWWDEDCKKKMR